MPRVKRGSRSRRRRNKIMKAAKGFVGARRRLYRPTVMTVKRAWAFAYRDRRNKKREFRKLWIIRINAAARQCGTSYSRLISWLNQSEVEIDRKVLADLAANDFPSFERLVEEVRPAA